jgi:type III secretion protein C
LKTKQFFLFLIFIVQSAFVPLQAIPWQKPEFYYYAQDENLESMLRNFCLSQGVNTVIDPRIEGKVSGLFQNVLPDDFLNQLSKAYGLIWFYDGNVLYIDPFDTITSQLLQVEYYDADRLLKMLQALGIEGSNFSLRSLDEQGLMLVSGSPRFVGMVYDILSKLEVNEKTRQGRLEVAFYPLKHAWAYDMKMKSFNTSINVPGVATILANLMVGGQLPSVSGEESGAGDRESAPAASALGKMQRLSGTQSTMAKNNPSGSANNQSSGKNPAIQPDKKNQKVLSDTVIQPDIRLNAVIIRDLKEKLPLYETLIKRLDEPVQVIHISAAIVDLENGYSRALGHKFMSVEKNNKTFGISPDGSVAPGAVLDEEDDPEDGPSSGFNFAAKFPINGANFLSKIQMLEKDGYAKVFSRPSVMTLDNVEAVIASSNTIYIDVQSDRDASLFEVDGGTILRVLPHVIEENGLRKIKLVVTIEDTTATFNATTKPSKTGIQLNTQAVILEGESLLIGGLFKDTKKQSYSGVPFLSRIPILGYLFKVDSREKALSERMFLITPKVIRMESGDKEGYSQFFKERLYNKENEYPTLNNTNFDPPIEIEPLTGQP